MAGSAYSGDFDNGELFVLELVDGGFSRRDTIHMPTSTLQPAFASESEGVARPEGGFAGQRLTRVGAPGEGYPDLGGRMNQVASDAQAEFGPARMRSLDRVQGTSSPVQVGNVAQTAPLHAGAGTRLPTAAATAQVRASTGIAVPATSCAMSDFPL